MFRTEIRPARIDAEKLRVNERYLSEHPTKSLQELDFHVAFEGRRIFDTLECVVYHGDDLVAFSFFDRGERGVYSKAGIYLPAYKAYSLGIYTMLLELEWCKSNGMEYYYPGYISPDTPLFDYKTKLGDVAFWNLRQRRWIPYRDFDAATHGPLTVLLDRIDALRAGLEDLDYRVPLYQYVFFEMQMMQKGRNRLLEQPFFLLLDCPAPQRCRIATYHPDLDAYECWDCDFNRMITFFEQPAQEYDLFRYVLELRKLLFRTSTIEDFLLRRREVLADPRRQRLRPREC